MQKIPHWSTKRLHSVNRKPLSKVLKKFAVNLFLVGRWGWGRWGGWGGARGELRGTSEVAGMLDRA